MRDCYLREDKVEHDVREVFFKLAALVLYFSRD